MGASLRKSGINLIGDFPWGTHFCQFYSTGQDLLDILVPYFKAGLENNEFCMWITSEPLGAEAAKSAMQKAMPDFGHYLKRGQIEIIPHTQWYLKGGSFKQNRVLNGWVKKLGHGQKMGYDGLRLTGNTFWLERNGWKDFTEYEEAVNKVIGNYKIVAICTYSLEKCNSSEIIDVVSNHQFALIKKQGRWERIESCSQKKIEDDLQKSQARFKANIGLTGQIPWTTNAKGEVIEDIPAWREFTGQSYQEIKGAGWSGALHPDDLKTTLKAWKKAVATKTKYELECRIRRHDGVYRNFLVRGIPFLDEKGNIQEWVGTCIDITERRFAEEKIRHMASFPQLNPNPIIEIDANARVTFSNLAAINVLKRLKVAKQIKLFLPQDFGEILQYLKANEKKDFIREVAIKDSAFLETLTALPELKIMRIYARDITERKLAEEALRESKERYHTLFEQSPGGILIIDPKTLKMLEFNDKACRHLGYTRKEFEALRISDFEVKVSPKENSVHIAKILKEGKDSFETRHRTKSGELHDVLVLIKKIAIMGKDLLFCVFHDITELKNIERALDESRRQLESRVAERTKELTQANRQLIQEISERKGAERSLGIRGAILKTMGRSSTRKEFLDTIVKFIKGLAGCRYIGIRILNEEKEIPYESYIGFSREFWEKENWLCINYDQCICIRAITGKVLPQDKHCITKGGSFRSGNAMEFMDGLSKEERAQFRGVCVESGFASLSVVPIYYKDKVIAAIHLADERKDMFPQEKIGFIEKLTPLIGEAIHKFENEDNIRQGHMSQRAIAELIRYSFEEMSLENILHRSLELILSLRWLGVESKASIYLVEDEPDRLILKAHKNLPEYLHKQCARISFGECLCGRAALEQKVQFSAAIDHKHEIICKEMMPHGHYCIPILFGKRAIGVINLYLPAGSRHDPRKEEFFVTFSNTLAEIIQRKEQEINLFQSNELLERVFSSTNFLIAYMDTKFNFIRVNKAYADLDKNTPDFFLGKNHFELYPNLENQQIFQGVLQTGRPYTAYARPFVYVKHPERGVTYCDWSLQPVKDVKGEVEGLVLFLVDTTEQKRSEEELRMAQKQLEQAKRLSDIGTLAATVAHELRNPLAAIRMASFNIKRKAGSPLLDKHFYNIEKKISESDQIINNLLFYSRLKQPHYENVDLYKILDECLEIAKKRSLKNSVKVKKKYRVLRRVWVEADPLQMRELFGNILNNAYDAMHGNSGTIQISAAYNKDGAVSIYFKDSGVGMDEEHIKKAHEPFFTTKAKGTGLGLTVCFQIVNLHNGKLELASKKGEGTTVTVILPIKHSL